MSVCARGPFSLNGFSPHLITMSKTHVRAKVWYLEEGEVAARSLSDETSLQDG